MLSSYYGSIGHTYVHDLFRRPWNGTHSLLNLLSGSGLDGFENFAENEPIDYVEQDERGGEDDAGDSVDTNRLLASLFHDFLRILLFAGRLATLLVFSIAENGRSIASRASAALSYSRLLGGRTGSGGTGGGGGRGVRENGTPRRRRRWGKEEEVGVKVARLAIGRRKRNWR